MTFSRDGISTNRIEQCMCVLSVDDYCIRFAGWSSRRCILYFEIMWLIYFSETWGVWLTLYLGKILLRHTWHLWLRFLAQRYRPLLLQSPRQERRVTISKLLNPPSQMPVQLPSGMFHGKPTLSKCRLLWVLNMSLRTIASTVKAASTMIID